VHGRALALSAIVPGMGAKSVIEVSAVSFPLPLRTPEEVKRSRSAGGPAVSAGMEDIVLASWR